MNYIVKETLIGSIINALFSITFFVAMFRGQMTLTLGGFSALTMDFLPQAFFVGLFAVLPSSLLTRKRLRAGTISSTLESKRFPLPQSLPVRIACMTLGALAVFGGGAVLILSLAEPMELSFTTGLLMKAAYGVLITSVMTPLAVAYLLVEDRYS